jgi:hypothetical protein
MPRRMMKKKGKKGKKKGRQRMPKPPIAKSMAGDRDHDGDSY